MDNIINTFVVGGVLGIALVVGITQLIKAVWKLEGRQVVILAGVVSALVALLGALPAFWPALREPIYYAVVAITLWLTSAGAYSAGNTFVKGAKK